MYDPRDAQVVLKWVEDRRVTHFLNNLDLEFESRRAAFCHQESLPTMDEAISAMIDEDKECYHCGEKRHKSYNCPNPRGNGGRAGTRGVVGVLVGAMAEAVVEAVVEVVVLMW
jgi:hypothetical protein